jgi:thiosulfate/3-mercaptopyruvate sulfurtransferase
MPEPLPPLLSPEDLPALIAEGAVLLDVRGEAAYAEGHLPDALRVDLDRDLSRAKEEGFDPAVGGRHPLPALKTFCATLGAWGIGPGTRVLCYDDQKGAYAARAWWMLRAIGHEAVQVLDGGLQAAELPLTKEAAAPSPVAPYPAPFWSRTTVDLPIVEKLARHAEWKVLDVRAGVRYRGESETLDPVAGHIPGALNLPFDQNLDAEGRFKPKAELRELYEDLLQGMKPDHLVVHCGSGVTACHTLLALEAADLPGGALFVGSWGEWCRSGKPIALGANP